MNKTLKKHNRAVRKLEAAQVLLNNAVDARQKRNASVSVLALKRNVAYLARALGKQDKGLELDIRNTRQANKQRIVDKKIQKVERQAFYFSREWRELRYKVLQHYGRKCMCCGATPETGAVMHVDHIKPVSIAPELKLEFNNLQVLCEDCNLGKSNLDETDLRPVREEEAPEWAK